MMPKPTEGPASRARLVALASVLQVAESLFPHPVPGIRLGLANVVTLVVIVRQGMAAGISLAAMRTVVSSLVLGTFLSPTFLLSFVGATGSALVMGLCWLVSVRGRLPLFSYLGISVAGSAAHMAAQLAMVGLVVQVRAFLWLWPYFCLAAVIAGLLTGWVARGAMRCLEQFGQDGSRAAGMADFRPDQAMPDRRQTTATQKSGVQRPTLLDRVVPEVRVVATMAVCLVVFLTGRIWLYALVLVLLIAAALLGRVEVSRLWCSLRRSVPMLLTLGAVPLIFTLWGRRLFAWGPIFITETGLLESARLLLRLLLLYSAATILMLTTPAGDLARGLGRLLRLFRFRVADRCRVWFESLVLALNEYPEIWQVALAALRRARPVGWANLPAELIARLTVYAESAGVSEG